jgi:hypothetical protein
LLANRRLKVVSRYAGQRKPTVEKPMDMRITA